MCKRPCWPTPAGAKALIDAGYGNRLMLDYWAGSPAGRETENNTYILCPASPGREGDSAPFWPNGGCVFQNQNGLCELHDLGLKPEEGQRATCKSDNDGLHQEIAVTWENAEAQALVDEWIEKCF